MDKRKLKLARRDENADSTGMGQARDTVKRIFAEAKFAATTAPFNKTNLGSTTRSPMAANRVQPAGGRLRIPSFERGFTTTSSVLRDELQERAAARGKSSSEEEEDSEIENHARARPFSAPSGRGSRRFRSRPSSASAAGARTARSSGPTRSSASGQYKTSGGNRPLTGTTRPSTAATSAPGMGSAPSSRPISAAEGGAARHGNGDGGADLRDSQVMQSCGASFVVTSNGFCGSCAYSPDGFALAARMLFYPPNEADNDNPHPAPVEGGGRSVQDTVVNATSSSHSSTSVQQTIEALGISTDVDESVAHFYSDIAEQHSKSDVNTRSLFDTTQPPTAAPQRRRRPLSAYLPGSVVERARWASKSDPKTSSCKVRRIEVDEAGMKIAAVLVEKSHGKRSGPAAVPVGGTDGGQGDIEKGSSNSKISPNYAEKQKQEGLGAAAAPSDPIKEGDDDLREDMDLDTVSCWPPAFYASISRKRPRSAGALLVAERRQRREHVKKVREKLPSTVRQQVREHEYVADILNAARPIAPKWSLQPRRVAGSGAEGAQDKCFRDSFDRPAEPVYYGYSRKHGGHMKRIPQFTLKSTVDPPKPGDTTPAPGHCQRLKLRYVTEPYIITPSFLGTERFSEKIIMPGLGAPDQPPIGHYGVADPKPSYVKKGIAMMPGFAVKSRTPMVIKGGSTDWLNPGPGHYDIPIRNDDPSRPHQPEFTIKATASNEWEKFVSESASQPGPGAYQIPTMLGLTHPTAILTSRARILCPIRNELRVGEC